MKFKSPDEKREYFRQLGSKGGRATVQKYGREFMAIIGAVGYESTTKKHFQGDEASHNEWLIKSGAHAYWKSTGIPMKRDFDGNPVWPEEMPEHPAAGNWVPF